MKDKVQIRISEIILLSLILISFLCGCKKSPEPPDAKFSHMEKKQIQVMKFEQLIAAMPKMDLYPRPIYKIEPYVEPNSLSPQKEYHYKPLFFPLYEPPFSDPVELYVNPWQGR